MVARLTAWLFAVPLFGASCFFAFTPSAFAERPPEPLLIGEVAWAGSSKSLSDEWLELWNLGDIPLDLTGYKLVGAGGTDGITLTGQVIAPQSVLLISNYSASDTKSALAIDPQLITSAISLSNSELHIQLMDDTGAIIDEAGDGQALPAGSSTPTKATMVRQHDGSWRTADTRERMDDGVADFGTPGICDGCSWTEPTPPPEPELVTTTTKSIITPTSTVEVIPEPEPEPVATTTEIITTIIDNPPPMLMLPTVTTTTPIVQTITRIVVVEYPNFRLQRIHPAPVSGQKEWVEVSLPDGKQLDALNGYALYDATGRIALFPPTDMTLISQIGQTVRIQLTTAKLNNSGDTVELHRPDGSVVERMTYSQTSSDQSWIKNAENTSWVSEGAVEEMIESNIVETPPPETIELPTVVEAEDEPPSPVAAPEKISISTPKPKITTPKPKTTTTKKTTSTTSAKPSSTKKADAVLPVTHDMLTKIDPNIRISIKGTVATKAGILNKNYYVLLSPDGHGVLVRGSSKQPTPKLGETVRVSGTLNLNDDGLSLGVGTKDKWEPITSLEAPPTPRPVDFNAPDMEDGWSLIEVTGTVRGVSTGGVTLDLGDAMLEVKIKSASGYRASRFVEGDVLRVRGLLDDRGDEPWLLVRMTEDIALVSHAALAKIAEPKRSMPDWLPFGAAGITIAASEGYRRLKRVYHERRERILATSLGSSS